MTIRERIDVVSPHGDYVMSLWLTRAWLTLEQADCAHRPAATPDPLDAILRAERIADVGRTVGLLSPRERDLVQALYWDGLTMSQVARAWHVTPARVRQLHQRALGRLRTWLAD